ncbi:MAG: RNA-binding S4 domain-containing protein [Bacilli bacterium]|nr:RNA-binding S4 domain-containing protein [Bacilli bacterium]
MRLDKFLKVSRIFKRRTIAKEVSKNHRITINGMSAKPSSEVKVDDVLVITYGNKELTISIKEVNEYVRKDMSEFMYEIINERKLN